VDSFTIAVTTLGQNARVSSAVVASPVTSTTGTPWPSAQSALIPDSPATTPLIVTSANASVKYVCDSAEALPIDPWYATKSTASKESSSPSIMYHGLWRPER
jgi:hypothetical protein